MEYKEVFKAVKEVAKSMGIKFSSLTYYDDVYLAVRNRFMEDPSFIEIEFDSTYEAVMDAA